MSTRPVETLELRALEQRKRLHQDATELKGKIAAAREKFSLVRNAREHFVGAALLVTLAGVATGFGFAGIFTRR